MSYRRTNVLNNKTICNLGIEDGVPIESSILQYKEKNIEELTFLINKG